MNEYMIGQFGWIEWMIYVTEMFKKIYKKLHTGRLHSDDSM